MPLKNIDYRYVIVTLMFLVTIPICLILFFRQGAPVDPALTVNKKVISKEELKRQLSSDSCEHNYKDLVNSIVVKELLLQEAIRIGINKEAAFVESIKTYYEQSLIKTLADRKYDELAPVIPEGMIERYRQLSGKKIHFTLFTYQSLDDFKQGRIMQQKPDAILFSFLSTYLRYKTLELTPGETSEPFPSFMPESGMDRNYMVFRLDKIEDTVQAPEPETDTEMIKALITDQKKEALMSDWIESLKKKASVSITPYAIPEMEAESTED